MFRLNLLILTAKKRNMRLLNKDFFVVCISGAIIAVCAYLLYIDLNSHIIRDDKSAVAFITFRKKIAQRRYSDNSLWEELSNHSPLFNYDSIRTDDDSSAVVTFKDGGEINIDSNSMIIIVKEGDEVKVNFEGGNISVKKGALNLSVKADKTSFALKNGRLSIAKDANGITADVEGGSADVGSAGVLSDSNSFRFSGGQMNIETKNIILKSPADGEKVITSSSAGDVVFNFEGLSSSTIELSKTRSFSKIYKTIPSKGNSNVSLRSGSYYWRVVDKNEKSEVRRFSVISDSPVKAVYPENNSQVFFANQNSVFLLRWSGAESASDFEVMLASDPEMNNIINSIKTTARFTSFPINDEGKYYWAVKANYSGSITGSEVASFSAVKQLRMSPPVLIAPLDSANVSVSAVKTGKVRFNWKVSSKKYRIELAKDSSFNDKVFSKEISTNKEILPPDTAVGKYYWRVASLDSDGKDSDYSSVRELNVLDSISLRLISPVTGAISGKGLQRFRWNDNNMGSLYRIDIAKDNKFKSVVHTSTSSERKTDVSLSNAGKYYWRVFLLGSDESILAESRIEHFRITETLSSPVILSPSNGSKIDAGSPKPITIAWKNVAGANTYYVSLKQIVGGEEFLLFSEKTGKNSITIRDLSKLKPGKIRVEVKSVSLKNGEIIAESKPDSVVFEFKLSEMLSAPEIRTQGLIYVK